MAVRTSPRIVRGTLIHLAAMAALCLGAGGAGAAPGGNGSSQGSHAGGPPPGHAQGQPGPPPHANGGHNRSSGTSTTQSSPTPAGPQSGHGANASGPYDSTSDGSPSANGNGRGRARGRPCAGCVGNADNKNPRGQLPNAAADGNQGYECDGNHGIARGNPAHSGCRPTTSAAQPAAETSGAPAPGVAAGAPAPSPAGDSPADRPQPPASPGAGNEPTGAAGDEPQEPDRAVPLGGANLRRLPFTGFGVVLMLLIGGASVATGLAMGRLARP